MSNYVKSTNFTAKDSLPTGDTNKVIRGSEFDTEFDAIATATGTKADLAGPTFTGTATFANLTATGTVNLTGATVSNLGTVTTVDINGGTIDGATIGANSASTGNFTTLSINGTAITSTAAELNILDGVTASTAEINLLDGVTATTAELNILDGVTATAIELNTLDGITASTAELNILDGVTATTAELNFVDGVTSNIQTQLDAKGTASSLSDLGVTATAAELNTLDGITSSTAELNLLDGVTATTAELNFVDGVTSNIQTQLDAKGTVSNLSDLSITATAAEINTLDGITATTAELNILDGKTFLDEDDMVSDSATGIPSQQSVKAYVDSQTGGGGTTLSGLTDTNITTPADGAVLFYDTTTSKWIDNVVSGDITIADTGVAAIGSGVIVDADVNASAAISVSKTALVDGTGLTLTGDTLSVDASQTQITAVGTIATGTWQGTAIANAYVADDLTISGGTVDNSVIGGTTAAAGTFTTLTGNQLDVDNIQIDANAVKSTNTNGNIELFPNGTGTTVLYGNTNPGTIVFNCESNSHGVTLKGPAHSAASTYTVALPDTLGTTQASGVVTSDANGVVTFDNGISEEYTAVASSSNATTVNLRDGTNFSHTLTENTTFTFSNPASSGKVSAFTLKIVQDASASGYTVTWPGSVDWPSATAPTLTATASAVDYFVFITHDGGTTYYGFTAGQALG
tara:strand:+ start:139 stop:2214 length:2076 start_codon:yes stop_codon:yes gene_type:complete